MYSAAHFPDDFDGIIAGSPATNFINLAAASGMWSYFFGSTTNNANLMSSDQLELVYNETMRQCDGIDGVVDGVITEPDACDFRPEELQCATTDSSSNSSTCLSRGQVAALKQLYSPLYGTDGKWIFPPYNLAGQVALAESQVFSGTLFQLTSVRFAKSSPY